jgi:hypothetical protein
MKTIVSCYPNVFAKCFDGTFTHVLSGLSMSLPFEEAWRRAVEVCKDLKDIAFPSETDPVGKYVSHSGKEYFLFTTERKFEGTLYCIECPDDTSLDLEEIQKREGIEIPSEPDDLIRR